MTDSTRHAVEPASLEELRGFDPSDMYSAIRGFPEQIRTALEISANAPAPDLGGIRRVLVLGMGGSAIGGDLFRSYISSFVDRNGVDVVVSRGYEPPPTDSDTLVVASSYSGNTEETLEAYDRAAANAGAVLVLTTGGRIAELARKDRHTMITLPGGLQPRAALAYSFFPLLHSLAVKAELFGAEVKRAAEHGIAETQSLIEQVSAELGEVQGGSNAAFSLALTMRGTVPVIYSAADRFDTVNLRWRGQIQENAKHLAFGNVVPEMNHNEINGWLLPEDLVWRHSLIFLHDCANHPQVKRRLETTERILGERVQNSVRIYSRGESLLARMFSLVHFGDWLSYYMATLNGQDPTPVPVIEDLKRELAAQRG